MTNTNVSNGSANVPPTRDWEALGLGWESQAVASRFGAPNDSDKRVVDANAQIIRLLDVDKARAAGLEEAILAGVNGTSWDVKAEAVCRAHGKRVSNGDAKPWSVDEKREAVYATIRGLRAPRAAGAVVTVTVVVLMLPDGTKHTGTDRTEYVAAYMAAGVDLGMPADVARMVGESNWDSARGATGASA